MLFSGFPLVERKAHRDSQASEPLGLAGIFRRRPFALAAEPFAESPRPEASRLGYRPLLFLAAHRREFQQECGRFGPRPGEVYVDHAELKADRSTLMEVKKIASRGAALRTGREEMEKEAVFFRLTSLRARSDSSVTCASLIGHPFHEWEDELHFQNMTVLFAGAARRPPAVPAVLSLPLDQPSLVRDTHCRTGDPLPP